MGVTYRGTSNTYYAAQLWMTCGYNFTDDNPPQPFIPIVVYWDDYDKVPWALPHVYDYMEERDAVSAQILGMDRFDGEAFEEQVREVNVLPDGNLQFRFSDGGTKVWKNLRLHQAWHEATVTDCFQEKIRYAICGNTYHRMNSGGRWVYWYRIGKKRSNVNYADFKLRCISTSILGLEEFDEAEFGRQIEEIMVLEDGSLEYHFREGRTQTWQRM